MEIEFKLTVPAPRLRAVDADLRKVKVKRTRLRARYFDTPDGTLAAAGIVLRLRQEGTRWIQTAKAAGQGPLHRHEHNVEIVDPEPDALREPDAKRHQGTTVGALLLERLEDSGAALIETFSTDIWRLSRTDLQGSSTVELALDVGVVRTPSRGKRAARKVSICELEIELLEGDVADLAQVAHRWCGKHGLWLSTVSKAEHGRRLLESTEAPAAARATPTTYSGKHADGGDVQRAVVASCLAQVLPNASEVASGNDDADVVHQLRVGIRRLRTALRDLDGLAKDRFDPVWNAPLVQAFRALGTLRDHEIAAASVEPELRLAGAPVAVIPALPSATLSAAAAVRDPAFQATLISLIALASESASEGNGPNGIPVGATPADAELLGAPANADGVRRLLRKRLGKLHTAVVRAGRSFDSLPTDEQHRTRKRLKRLRYLAEFAAPIFGQRRTRRYLKKLEPLQDALGSYNDDVSALETYRAAAAEDGRAWFAVGWLSATQVEKARDCRRVLRKLTKHDKFW